MQRDSISDMPWMLNCTFKYKRKLKINTQLEKTTKNLEDVI